MRKLVAVALAGLALLTVFGAGCSPANCDQELTWTLDETAAICDGHAEYCKEFSSNAPYCTAASQAPSCQKNVCPDAATFAGCLLDTCNVSQGPSRFGYSNSGHGIVVCGYIFPQGCG